MTRHDASVLGRPLGAWLTAYPLIRDLMDGRESTWFNPGIAPAAVGLGDVGLTMMDVEDAQARLTRFAPLLVVRV